MRASVQLCAGDPIKLLGGLLGTLPQIPGLTFEAGAEFSVLTDAQALVDLGADLGNCLAEVNVCIEYLVSEIVFVAYSCTRTGTGVLAMRLPDGSDSRARATLCESQVAAKDDDPMLQVRIGAFVDWFASSGYPCSDFRQFRAAVIRTRKSISEQLRGVDRMAVWRGVFGGTRPRRSR